VIVHIPRRNGEIAARTNEREPEGSSVPPFHTTLFSNDPPGDAFEDQSPGRGSDDIVTLVAPARLKRVGREMRMLVENSDDHSAADPSLLRIIARAHDIQARLLQNTRLTVHDIAREERVSAAYIYTLLRLPCLAPTSLRLLSMVSNHNSTP
jgi:hypothetical protein